MKRPIIVIPDIRKQHQDTARHLLLLQVPQLPLDHLAGARLIGTQIAKEDTILAVRISTGDFWVLSTFRGFIHRTCIVWHFSLLVLFRIPWDFWE
jgi:hypothetical protein